MRRGDERLSLLDLYERTPVLLCGPAADQWRAAGRRIAERTGVPLTCYGIGQDLLPEDPEAWGRLHAVGDDGAVLVRPDGFIAWRSAAGDPDAERMLERVLDRVLRRD